MEITELDIMREPKLKEFAIPVIREGADLDNLFDRIYILPNPCPFQHKNRCTIYPTRPNICVAFLDKCLSSTNPLSH
ncbi:MAG: hypothetical protein GY799_21340 [Desulfobulbaceae bacterium]|nr:hypothetical protein [Desulfobulbaceae bacterium]